MKCYFCLTEPETENSVYLDLLYVSLKSARQNTSLDLHVLYDGSQNGKCYSILKEFNVRIIPHKFSHKEYLKKTYSKEYIRQTCGHDISYEKIAGTFMRFDIPFVETEDEFVFYSDIDVLFLKDFSEKNFDSPMYLAASAEFSKNLNDMTYFNAGILYMNVKQMRQISSAVFNMLKNGVRNKINLFDQGYLNQLCFDKFTIMPLEFNWKPYWGYNKDAYIIHFHGMKPLGNIQNSGFGMSEDILFHTLNGHFQDIDGYLYYLMKYFELLEKDGKLWLSSFISLIFKKSIEKINVKQPDKKYKKYRKLFKIQLVLILLLTLTIFITWSF